MLTATLRVEERSLRKKELDILPKLLERIESLRSKNPALSLTPSPLPSELDSL